MSNSGSQRREIPATAIETGHKIRLSAYLEKKIASGDNDRIARQYLPDRAELVPSLTDLSDPIGDHAHAAGHAIIHRYPDRVLLLATDHCAAYCRFCFRKDRVGKGDGVPSDADMNRALSYIADTPGLREIILSGGDPLILSPRRLNHLVKRVAAIPHIRMLRVHTRLPVADPDRVTAELAKALRSRLTSYIVVHVNHPDELTAEAIAALARLRDSGAILLSQSVLLRGINDDAATLEALFRGLTENGVKPYYLHHPDLVRGTAHFQLSPEDGEALMKALRGRVSGICLPTYVLDIPGGYGKVPVNGSYFSKTADGRYSVEDIHGNRHAYPPADARVVSSAVPIA